MYIHDSLTFEWDRRKETANLDKHGVSFREAQTAFYDEDALVISDPAHSENEDRFILLGLSFKSRALVVCHCYREGERIIRLISAKKTNRHEEGEYWKPRQ